MSLGRYAGGAATTALALLVVGFGVHQFDDRLRFRFSLDHVTPKLGHEPTLELQASSQSDLEQAQRITHQPFRYLGQGCQSYAFLSGDGRYVLKFIKHQRQESPFWVQCGAWVIPKVAEQQRARRARKERELQQIYKSWKLAFERMREDAGLIHVHFGRTDQGFGSVHLVTKGRERMEIPLDRLPFLIQKRSDPFNTAIERLIKRGDITQAQLLVDRLIDLVLADYGRGLADHDRWIARNSGVLKGRPLHIDVGSFVQNERARNPEVYGKDLFIKGTKMRLWLERLSPAVASHLEQRLQAVLGERYFDYTYVKESPIYEEAASGLGD